ncbi:MAG: hypothetical protein IT324_02375 [Anaerolineae bacterium]|nr:hypothetical protein [Anaerolineae bacterium]
MHLTKLMVGLMLLVLLVFTSTTQPITAARADESFYIQINNGSIVTNREQQPQIVAQFGNRSQQTLYQAVIACFFPTSLGQVTTIYPGPFHYTEVKDFSPYTSVNGGTAATDFLVGFIIDNVTLIPGQNYNFAFNIFIAKDAPVTSYVICDLFGNTQNDSMSGIVSAALVDVKIQ